MSKENGLDDIAGTTTLAQQRQIIWDAITLCVAHGKDSLSDRLVDEMLPLLGDEFEVTTSAGTVVKAISFERP